MDRRPNTRSSELSTLLRFLNRLSSFFMIDHILGRPNPGWKRTHVFLVILFWTWQIARGNPAGLAFLRVRKLNKYLAKFTPWQLIVSTLTAVYTMRNFDKIVGLTAPEPLAGVYSPSYYRATWISTGLDAGFASALSIRPKWLKDLLSIVFSLYYIIYANEADEKLRRFRALPTIEFLRVTWHKTTNPYLRALTHLPPISIRRKILLSRPECSNYRRPITAYLFFAGKQADLAASTELILDYPGGGFVCMTPEHHEERLRIWALRSGRPVLSIDYGKAPEYPYPFGIDEAFDAYRAIVSSKGRTIGMSGRSLSVILSGDSAGATMAVNVIFKILEHNMVSSATLTANSSRQIPLPVTVLFSYAFFDFNFSSWMTTAERGHLQHIAPDTMVGNKEHPFGRRKKPRRHSSWKSALRNLASGTESEEDRTPVKLKSHRSAGMLKSGRGSLRANSCERAATLPSAKNRPNDDVGILADTESEDGELLAVPVKAGRAKSSVHWTASQLNTQQLELSAAVDEADARASRAIGRRGKEAIETKLTMTSRTAYFQDRIISPSMMRAMAIMYIGPHQNPDFSKDFHISPILAPNSLLAQFPPIMLQCGEKDPFVDDTIIFAGRIKQAKHARKAELNKLIANATARPHDTLQMTTSLPEEKKNVSPENLLAWRRERRKLEAETEEDWVGLKLFSSWSHGYLQMVSLMGDVVLVVEEQAEWMADAFDRYAEKMVVEEDSDSALSTPGVRTPSETEDEVITFTTKKNQLRERSGTPATHSPAHSADSNIASSSNEGLLTPSKQGRQAGETITQEELLRRRRLVDIY